MLETAAGVRAVGSSQNETTPGHGHVAHRMVFGVRRMPTVEITAVGEGRFGLVGGGPPRPTTGTNQAGCCTGSWLAGRRRPRGRLQGPGSTH